MTDHEKRIREALGDAEAADFPFADARATDLRALLADLDAMREALKYARRFLNAKDHDVAFVDAALKGASA